MCLSIEKDSEFQGVLLLYENTVVHSNLYKDTYAKWSEIPLQSFELKVNSFYDLF